MNKTNNKSDIEIFFEAVRITDEKYGIGRCNWQEYLRTGSLYCFTSTNGARESMNNVDYMKLCESLINRALKNIVSYYQNRFSSTYTENKTLNSLIDNVDYYRNNYSQADAYDVIVEEFLLLDPVEILEIIKGNIKSVPSWLAIVEKNRNIASYFNEVVAAHKVDVDRYYSINNEISKKSPLAKKDELLKEKKLLARIKELELENLRLKELLKERGYELDSSPRL